MRYSRRRKALSKLIFPGLYRDFADSRERYGDISVIPSRLLFYGLQAGRAEEIELEAGIRLVIELEPVGDADERGMRNVLLRLNGPAPDLRRARRSRRCWCGVGERADPRDRDQLAAPLAGVVTLTVAEGDEVSEGQPVAV